VPKPRGGLATSGVWRKHPQNRSDTRRPAGDEGHPQLLLRPSFWGRRPIPRVRSAESDIKLIPPCCRSRHYTLAKDPTRTCELGSNRTSFGHDPLERVRQPAPGPRASGAGDAVSARARAWVPGHGPSRRWTPGAPDMRERLTAQILAERDMLEAWPGFDQEPMLELHLDRVLITLTEARDGQPAGHTVWTP
jgi:hypothetical protein